MKKSDYGDLLAFTTIDENAVDTLFRVFLDTKLVGFAQQHPGSDGTAYWNDVHDFRLEVLDPYTDKGALAEAEREKRTAKVLGDPAAEREFRTTEAFLYWFDMRADYWRKNPPTPELLRIIVPPIDLVTQQREAEIFRERLAAAASYRNSPSDERSVILLSIIAKEDAATLLVAAATKAKNAADQKLKLALGTINEALAKAEVEVASKALDLAHAKAAEAIAKKAEATAKLEWATAIKDLQGLSPKP